jgi:hypothetical protein
MGAAGYFEMLINIYRTNCIRSHSERHEKCRAHDILEVSFLLVTQGGASDSWQQYKELTFPFQRRAPGGSIVINKA